MYYMVYVMENLTYRDVITVKSGLCYDDSMIELQLAMMNLRFYYDRITILLRLNYDSTTVTIAYHRKYNSNYDGAKMTIYNSALLNFTVFAKCDILIGSTVRVSYEKLD